MHEGREEVSLATAIDTFVSHFHEVLSRFGELPNEPILVVLKKLGFVAAIDGMSKVSPHHDSKYPRERFVAFIRRFSGWGDCERISLPHLEQALSKDTRPEFEEMRRHVKSLLASWPSSPSGPLAIACDPMPDQLVALWPREDASFKKLANVDHERFRHAHLLYSSRNFLAHELREGSWHTIGGDATFPHYSYTKIESVVSPRERWLLYYPVEFFSSLAASCLVKLEEWLKVEHIDPYERRRFGDFFLEQLN